MLANSPTSGLCVGNLSKEVQKPDTFREELIGFIAHQLPVWRDRTERRVETAETLLTTQVCAHLNTASRLIPGWDILQFRTEDADEEHRGRRMDLVAAPIACTIIIAGRSYIDFDILLPIECKRLPTPRDIDRDEREYVFSEKASTGGIQRFKTGNHGSRHNFGAMIGYIQEGTSAQWDRTIEGWIDGLADQAGWSSNDRLRVRSSDATGRVMTLHSSHARLNGLPDIELRHLWIEMN